MHRTLCTASRGELSSFASSWLRAFSLAAALLAFPVALLAAGTGSITGRVMNKGTGDFLRNAVVSVEGSDMVALAGDGGFYRLPAVPAGTVTLKVEYTGLDPATATVAVAEGQTVSQDFALTSGLYDQEIVELGEFVVASQREGNAKAIMEQRFAPNPKKVIAADAIGNVSEGNVGEFLKLMPGVVMDYVEADTRSARVRGLNAKYTVVLMDGMTLANAGSSNIGTGRAYEFEQLSIDSVETVELTKTPTPDQPSSVAGTVNLKTKSAFDRAGRRIDWKVGLATNSYYASLSKTEGWDDKEHYKMLPNYSLEYSDILADGKLGIFAGMSHNSTIAAQKHIWFWMNAFDADPSNNATEVPTMNWIWLQDGPKPTDRDNYNVRLDYRVSDDLRVWGRIGYNTYDARFYNRTLSLRPSTYATGATKTSWTVTDGRISIDSNQFMTKEGNTIALSGGANYNRGTFGADLSFQWVRQKNWYDNLKYGHFTDFSSSLSNISWTMTRPSAGSTDVTFTQTSGANWRDPANYTFDANSFGWHERRSQDERGTLRLDLRNEFQSGTVKQVLNYGLFATNQDLEVHRWGMQRTNPVGADGVYGTSDDPRPINFVDDNYRSDWDFTANMNDFPALSPWKMYADYAANPSHYVDSANNAVNRRVSNWYFKEKILAAYAQDTITLGKLEIAPGFRYEYTDSSGTGNDAANGNVPVTGGNSYNAILPYLHANYRISDTMILRGTYHTAITRADIANLVPGIASINEDQRELTASNPDLKEEISRTLNLSFEYYFEPVGQFTASVFNTRVKDLQVSSRQQLGPDGWAGNVEYADWFLISRFNAGSSVSFTGFELDYQQQLSFLPGPFKGLGVFANYTRLNYGNWSDFLGSPKWMSNGGVSYDIGGFSGRLNANYVGRILNVASATAPEYQRDRLALDINLEYKLGRSMTLFVDARNILNEPSQYTYRAVEDNFIRVLKTGTIWMCGVKGTF